VGDIIKLNFRVVFDSVEKKRLPEEVYISPNAHAQKQKRHDLDSDRPFGPPWFAVVETSLPCMPVFVSVVSPLPLPSTPILQNVEGGTSFLF
jgi:hypothetical protein